MSDQPKQTSHEEQQAPKWINNEFFLKVLKNSEQRNDLELLTFTLKPKTGKIEHYASVIICADVKFRIKDEIKTKSLVIKCEIEQEGRNKELFKESSIFETEVGMYSQVIPKFEAILKSAGDDTKLAPSCLYYSLSPNKVLVFEDLSTLGYVTQTERGLNLEETKAALSKIAKWHAISFKINLEEPEFFKLFYTNPTKTLKPKETPAFRDGITNFIEMLDDHADLKLFKPYFETLKLTVIDRWLESASEFLEHPQPDAIYVLCHGDFHHKNMMFKYDKKTGNIAEILLLDLQMCHMAPAAMDVINSIYMIMDTEPRLKHLDEMIYFYFKTFRETLRKIECKIKPTLLEFKQQLIKHRHFELFQLTSFSPMMISLDEGKYSIEDLMTNAEMRRETYKSPKYVDEVRQLLPKYLYNGYLEQDNLELV